jgi:hypothetical protein
LGRSSLIFLKWQSSWGPFLFFLSGPIHPDDDPTKIIHEGSALVASNGKNEASNACVPEAKVTSDESLLNYLPI